MLGEAKILLTSMMFQKRGVLCGFEVGNGMVRRLSRPRVTTCNGVCNGA